MLQLARAIASPVRRDPADRPPPEGNALPAPFRRTGRRPAAAPAPAPSDAELVVRAREGDEGALAELFRRHRPAAMAVARRELRDRADADDAASEAFTRAFERLGTLREPSRFRAFLLAIVRSVASDRRRAVQRTPPSHDLDLRPAAGDVEAAVVTGEASRALLAAVETLPARQRYAVRRFYWDEVPVAALAVELGASTNATTQLLFRARAALALRTGESCRRPSRPRR